MTLRFGMTMGLLACSADASAPATEPIDPFTGDTWALVLEQPARSFAATPAPVRFAFTLELSDELLVAHVDASSIAADETVSVGQGPRDVAAIDVDRDSLIDLVSADTSGSSLSVVAADTEGFQPAVMLAADYAPKHLASLDADGDGWSDLLVSAGLGAESRILLWRNASGVFAAGDTGLPLAGADRCHAGDLDGDGAPDGIVVLSSMNQLAIIPNDGRGGFGTPIVLDVCDTPISARVADLNASGTADVVMACKGEALVLLDPMLGQERLSLAGGQQLYDVAVADFDGDGLLDVAAIDVAEHTLRLWLAPMSHSGVVGVHPAARGPIRLEALDIDQDGDLDLAVLAYEQRALQVFINRFDDFGAGP